MLESLLECEWDSRRRIQNRSLMDLLVVKLRLVYASDSRLSKTVYA